MKYFICYSLVFLLCSPAAHINAQDINQLNHYPYIELRGDAKNNVVPKYPTLQPDIEAGIRNVLRQYKIPVVRSKEEIAEKGIDSCQILICTYTLGYATGMMYNANITCTLTFTNCPKQEVFTTSGKKMVGAVVGANAYVNLVTAMMKQYHGYGYAYSFH